MRLPSARRAHATAYAPIAGSDSLLVHTDGKPRSVPYVALANEKADLGSSAPYPVSMPRVATNGAAARPGSVAQAAPSPMAAARLNLGTSLGASAAAPKPGSIPALTQDDRDDELATVAGRVESIIGADVTVKSPAGLASCR